MKNFIQKNSTFNKKIDLNQIDLEVLHVSEVEYMLSAKMHCLNCCEKAVFEFYEINQGFAPDLNLIRPLGCRSLLIQNFV